MEVLEGMAAGVWASAIVYVFVKEILNKNEAWWGYINSSFCWNGSWWFRFAEDFS